MFGYDPWAHPSPDDLLPGDYAVRTPPSLDALPPSVRPDGDPPAVPERLPSGTGSQAHEDQRFPEADLIWGTSYEDGEPTLGLRADGSTFERGETVTVVLVNVQRRRFEVEYQSVGNRGKYDLQVYTDAGWQEVRAERGGETDGGVLFAPGRGYQWRFELAAADGRLRDSATGERFRLRDGLPAGRYRLVYWACEEPLAVAFDLLG